MIRTWLLTLAMCASVALVVMPHAAIAAEPTPQQMIEQLLPYYGHRLEKVTYIPALAVHSRLRYSAFSEQLPLRQQVISLLDKQFDLPKTQVEFAGFLPFAELAHRETGPLRERMVAAVRNAADQLFDPMKSHQLRKPTPNEMSDAVFMCGPILCEAGALTGDRHYFEAAVQYLAEMRSLRQREDGLYRHGALCDAAWGRGNGFPAVGATWSLTRLPPDCAGRDELLHTTKRHLQSLLAHQTEQGFWRQGIDVPHAYEELTATAMIGFALERGLQNAWWSENEYQAAADRAWQAVCSHVGSQGELIDVCEGTGTQKSLEDYLKRKAIRGRDDRGGAMVMLFANERLASEIRRRTAPLNKGQP